MKIGIKRNTQTKTMSEKERKKEMEGKLQKAKP